MLNLLDNLETKNILVVGDIMLDIYYEGDVNRISPEAPVPVFHKKNEKSVPGGAANVAANLVAARQNVCVMSTVGNDMNGKELISTFDKRGIDHELVISTKKRTNSKTRFISGNNQQVMRVDVEDVDELGSDDCRLLLSKLKRRIKEFDIVIISDYLKGLMSYEFTQGVLKIANEYNIPVIIDVKDSRTQKYNGSYLLKPNLKELHDLTELPVSTTEAIVNAAMFLKKKCNSRYVLTTCGSKGMVLVGDSVRYIVEAEGHEVFDVTGAGDTTIAYMAACISNGISVKRSVDVANYAAGIQISKAGTSAVYLEEVRKALSVNLKIRENKIIDRVDAKRLREIYKDKRIVFTNGCFDILHIGHIQYLQKTAELGDILVIGLNSDRSVKKLKGIDRPINNQKERAEILNALSVVDHIVVFEEDTPYDLIKDIQPDVLAKGADYQLDNVVGKDIVEMRGGKVELIPFVEGKSTTQIIERIKK